MVLIGVEGLPHAVILVVVALAPVADDEVIVIDGLPLHEGGAAVGLDDDLLLLPAHHASPPDARNCRYDDAEQHDGAHYPHPGVVVVVVGYIRVTEGGLVGVHAVGVVVAAVRETQ